MESGIVALLSGKWHCAHGKWDVGIFFFSFGWVMVGIKRRQLGNKVRNIFGNNRIKQIICDDDGDARHDDDAIISFL